MAATSVVFDTVEKIVRTEKVLDFPRWMQFAMDGQKILTIEYL